jgi:hypothetical protein
MFKKKRLENKNFSTSVKEERRKIHQREYYIKLKKIRKTHTHKRQTKRRSA